MEDSNRHNAAKTESRKPLGISSFDQKERDEFGQSIRLAMSCIEGSPPPTKGYALPHDEASIRQRLKALSQEITSNQADLLELLVRFDDLQGWKKSGASHCAVWMNFEIGISTKLSWEYLRVGRKLLALPTLRALFRAGKLSWSKVRLITHVADEDNENLLCHAALDASVTDVKRICERYKWNKNDKGEAENAQALQQWNSRSFTWNEASNGSTRIQLTLPPELAQAFLNSVEHSLGHIEDNESGMSQRRADAALLMAETSLQSAGRQIATADRFQVIVSVDAADLSNTDAKTQSNTGIPKKRPTVKGAGPIAFETARRLACDCSITTLTMINGEPIDIGRKTRVWPVAMARAINNRDQHCIWPGCTHTHHLQIHHQKPWGEAGVTAVHNGLCLCTYHHTMVHEGGYSIERVDVKGQRLNEQFIQQQHASDINKFDFEKELRNDKESFTKIRKLSPTRYRFRIVDSSGNPLSHNSDESTRVACSEPLLNSFYGVKKFKHVALFTYETPDNYEKLRPRASA